MVGNFNYDIYIRENGKNTRLTKLNSYIKDANVSPDGTRIAFLSDEERNQDFSLWVMNSDGTGLTEIILPKKHDTPD